MSKRVSFDGTTNTLKTGETTILTDTNNVLADYNSVDVTKNGIRFIHNKGENTMTIIVEENCTLENYKFTESIAKEIGLIKAGTEDKSTTAYIEFANGVQDQLYSLNYNDPVTLSFELAIEAKGKLELKKLDSNGTLVSGAVFTVSNNNGFSKDVTVTNGIIEIDDLKPGVYTIREKTAPYGYLLDTKDYQVEVRSGEGVNKTIPNDEPTRKSHNRKNRQTNRKQ